MTDAENRELAGYFGICWHEGEWIPGAGLRCKHCKEWAVKCYDPHYSIKDILPSNPDFSDPRVVLREMEKAGKLRLLLNNINGGSLAMAMIQRDYVPIRYILDENNEDLIAHAALELLRKEAK